MVAYLPTTCGLSVFWGKWGNLPRGEGVRSEDYHSATNRHPPETCRLSDFVTDA